MASCGLGAFIAVGGSSGTLLSLLIVSVWILLCASLHWPHLGFTASLATYFASISAVPKESIGIDVRLAAVPFVGLLCIQAAFRPRASLGNRRTANLLMAVAALAMSSTLWSDLPGNTAEAGLSLVGMAALVWASGRLFDGRQIRDYLVSLLGIVVLLSAAAAFLPIGHVGLRVSGVTGNPNALGLIVVLFLPLAALSQRSKPLLAVALVLLILSASRAAGLAAIAELLVLVASISRTGLRRFLFIILAAGLGIGSWLLIRTSNTDPLADTAAPSITRLEDSRMDLWADNVTSFAQRPTVGTGWDAYRPDTANSYLKTLVEAGIAGLILLVVTMRHVARQARAGPAAVSAIAVGGLVNAVFESWLFVGGSFFALVFWLTISSAGVSTDEPAGIPS